MTNDPNDITNDVFSTKSEPWDTMDAIVGVLRDAFAAVGVVATLAFIVGYFWAAPL